MWVILALLSAKFNGGKVVGEKYLINMAGINIYLLGIYNFLVITVVTGVIALYLGEFTAWSDQRFWTLVSLNVSLNFFANLLYFLIIRKHDASLLLGIQSIEPVFIALIAYLAIGETLSIYGMGGIFVCILGAVLLQKSRIKNDLEDLLRHSPWMLTFLYMGMTSSATVASKMAVTIQGIFAYLATRYGLLLISFIIMYVIARARNPNTGQDYHFKWYHLGTGFLTAGSVIFEMLALQQAKTAYVESIRRTSLFFSLLFESLFLKNKWNMLRLLACLMLFLGAGIITLLG